MKCGSICRIANSSILSGAKVQTFPTGRPVFPGPGRRFGNPANPAIRQSDNSVTGSKRDEVKLLPKQQPLQRHASALCIGVGATHMGAVKTRKRFIVDTWIHRFNQNSKPPFHNSHLDCPQGREKQHFTAFELSTSSMSLDTQANPVERLYHSPVS